MIQDFWEKAKILLNIRPAGRFVKEIAKNIGIFPPRGRLTPRPAFPF